MKIIRSQTYPGLQFVLLGLFTLVLSLPWIGPLPAGPTFPSNSTTAVVVGTNGLVQDLNAGGYSLTNVLNVSATNFNGVAPSTFGGFAVLSGGSPGSAVNDGESISFGGTTDTGFGSIAIGLYSSTQYGGISIGTGANAPGGGVAIGEGAYSASTGINIGGGGDSYSGTGLAVFGVEIATASGQLNGTQGLIDNSSATGSSGQVPVANGSGGFAWGTAPLDDGTGSVGTANEVPVANGSTFTWTAFPIPGSMAGGADVSLGALSSAGSVYTVALGELAYATNTGSVAIGWNSKAESQDDVSVGVQSLSTNSYSVAIGYQATATNAGVALGYNARSYGAGVEMGNGSYSGGGAAVQGHEFVTTTGQINTTNGLILYSTGSTPTNATMPQAWAPVILNGTNTGYFQAVYR